MTYTLNPEASKIKSPVVLRTESRKSSADTMYAAGTELANAVFEKNTENSILLTARENRAVNNTNWIGEEMTECGFF